jgi:hypothetical protein
MEGEQFQATRAVLKAGAHRLDHSTRLSESARTEKYDEARDLLKRREGAIADGVPVSPKVGRLRFEDAERDIVSEYTVNNRKTLGHLKRRLKLHVKPFFGRRRMADITTADIRAFTEKRLAADAAPAEVNRELAILKRMYTLAIAGGRLMVKPHIPMLREDNVSARLFRARAV